jgi:hypothetical protein
MKYFKLEVNKELFTDIYVSVEDSTEKYLIPSMVRKRLEEILSELDSSDWDEDDPEVGMAYPCTQEEANKYGIFDLTDASRV